MSATTSHARQIGLLTVLSGLLALLCNVLIALAINLDFELLEDPMQLFFTPQLNLSLYRWSMLADLAGFYLLLLPVIFYLQGWLQRQTRWARLLTFCASAYVLVGAIGAAALATAGHQLLAAYPTAPAPEQRTIQLLFQTLFGVVNDGLWNQLEMTLGATWWIGLGLVLRPTWRGLGTVSVGLGLSCVLDLAGNLLGLPAVASAGLNVYLLLAPLWACWLGLGLVRGRQLAVEPVREQVAA